MRRLLKRVLGLGLLALVLVIAGFALAVAFYPIPEPNDFAVAETSTVTYSDGTSTIAALGDVTRTSVPLSSVPEHVRQAVLSAEDRDFYAHDGFSPQGITRAMINNVTGGGTAGRLHDHPAVRQERLPDPGPDRRPQGQGADPVDQARGHGVQVGHPRGLPQHHLLRPRRLRDRGREPGLLRASRLRVDAVRGHRPGRGDPVAEQLRAADPPEGPAGALRLRGLRHGRAGVALPGRFRRADHAGVRAGRRVQQVRRPGRLHRAGGAPGAVGRRIHRLADRQRRPAHHHHHRPRSPGRSGGRGRRAGPLHEHRGPADRRRVRGSRHRRHPGHVRRAGLRDQPAQQRHPGHRAGGFHLQGVRARSRFRAGSSPCTPAGTATRPRRSRATS